MTEVSDRFLLQMAEISGGLFGLFVGVGRGAPVPGLTRCSDEPRPGADYPLPLGLSIAISQLSSG